MERPDMPDDYEQRLAQGRRAADTLPRGPARESALRALAAAPERQAYEAARDRASRADAIVEELAQSVFDGTDPERVAWLRLDYTGRLRGMAFSPTIDRLSNPMAAAAVTEAWAAAEAARFEAADRLESAVRALGRARPDQDTSSLRTTVAAHGGERFEYTSDDDLCSAAVDLEGRLSDFRFLVPNATLDYDCETLAQRASEAIQLVQARAGERLTEVTGGDV